MRIAASALVLIIIASEVQASNWVPVGRPSKTEQPYVDVSGIVRDGEARIIWEKFAETQPTGSNEAYSIDHTRYDCAKRTYTLLSWSHYRSDGTTVASETIPDYSLQAQDVVPDSVAESILHFVCR